MGSKNLVRTVKPDDCTAVVVKYIYLILVHYISFPE